MTGSAVTVNFRDSELQKAYDTGFAAGNLGGEQEFIAKVRDVTPSLSEPAAIRRVLWEIDNSQHLLEPQTYSGIKLTANAAYNCLAVPLKAMVNSAHSEVYVYTADGKIKRQTVVTGANDGTYIEVISGLSEGDVVITSQARGFEDGMAVEVKIEDEGEAR